MTNATLVRDAEAEYTAAAASPGEGAEDAFALEVHVIADVRRDLLPTACDTNDGCKGTCASACTST